ncbi:endonuclease/exonuclease/phosphatase family protein [Maribacter sp. HTCC2170]|uniref:endonuclease/exonuclease/phosphatase family protein n=1 Tax=Maribacter sp. (strain HTCC2170 / KCCM 42371) TaxID=313603 RepID=UPI00006B4881|nr:endonuclease/exonuclease/phosphatase family protein [Maribacter sp. HTCC2170]EAR01779.1 hypothetical protein FB2170_14663 [Maribacter sp. HTCC2170]
MKKAVIVFIALVPLCMLMSCSSDEELSRPIIRFNFNDNVSSEKYQLNGTDHNFEKGIDGQALVLKEDKGHYSLNLDSLALDGSKDFSVQFWIKTNSSKPTVFLSQKDFTNKGIIAQKNPGWALYSSGGTFGWNIGSGERRINYERDNGGQMPINDGEWHQLTITYSKKFSEMRLYYDGNNKAIYKVNFDFSNDNALVLGAIENQFDYDNTYSPDIISGRANLQVLVDEFNELGLEPLKNEEFLDLIVDPEALLKTKLKQQNKRIKLEQNVLSKVLDVRKKMAENPYTVFQNMKLTVLKPVSKIYSLLGGKVVVNADSGMSFTKSEQLYASNFSMDNLSIWDNILSSKAILKSFEKYKKTETKKIIDHLKDYTVGVWNIWHGGIHWSMDKDGWDSRMRIVEIIKEKNLDVILMQETYSNGDFIAAELGYYFATTSDWDYKYQGANISVISRYPITELQVSEETEFNNVAVKLKISETQEIWAMSNWYGMSNFNKVFDYNKSRFDNSDSIPVFFGGDFNAVPHEDGGENLASEKMLVEGFTDAYRSLYPDVEKHPGFTHQSDVRIDQLYYKGRGLMNTSTKVISTWPSGFPSDHFLIVSKFELD